MRCSDCNKFVSFDEQDPEIEDISVDDEGSVQANVRIVNACDQCGAELKEATLDMETDDPCDAYRLHLEDVKGEAKDHKLEVEETSSSRTQRSEGKGRGTKTFYGATIDYKVTCGCGKFEHEGTMEDDTQASSMDEMQ